MNSNNILDAVDSRASSSLKIKKEKPMTLIVGFIAKQAIVFGADSQTSNGDAKRIGTKKLHLVPFKNGQVLIGESGSATTAQQTIRSFRRIAAETEITDQESVELVSKMATRETYEDIKATHSIQGQAAADYISRNEFSSTLMVGFHANNQPHIHKIRLEHCIAAPSKGHFETAGSGSEVGDIFASQFSSPGMTLEAGLMAAAISVEMSCRTSIHCGLPMNLAVLKNSAAEPMTMANRIGRPYHSRTGRGYILPPPECLDISTLAMEVYGIIKEEMRKLSQAHIEIHTSKILDAKIRAYESQFDDEYWKWEKEHMHDENNE